MPKPPHVPSRRDLLSLAFGSEIDWEHAAPVIRGFFPGEGEFVYFIAEPDEGPVKIGRAQHPIKRLRELQIGNPRRLRIERLVFGGADVERLLHEYWHAYAISGNPRSSELNAQYRLETEWFKAEAREAILTAADAILKRQQTAEAEEGFAVSVVLAMAALGHERKGQDTVRQLSASGGYAERRVRGDAPRECAFRTRLR